MGMKYLRNHRLALPVMVPHMSHLMVSIYGGPSSFVEYSCLTYEEIVVSSQVSELPSECFFQYPYILQSFLPGVLP